MVHARKQVKNVLTLTAGLALAGWAGSARAQMAGHVATGHGEEMHGMVHAANEKAEATGHSHEACELHGGQVAMTSGRHFETVFAPDGIRVYVYTGNQTPEMTGKAKGTATLIYKDGTTKEIPLVIQTPAAGEATVYFCPMHPDVIQMMPGKCPKCGDMTLYAQDYLFAKADLAKVAPGSLKATIRINGLRGQTSEIVFTEPFAGPSGQVRKAAPAAAREEAGATSHEGQMQGHMH